MDISPKMARFQNNFTEMFLLCPFTKIAKMVRLSEQNGRQKLKVEKSLNNISS